MKFIVNTGALLKQLQAISGAISTNNVLPILENFNFDLKNKTLQVFASDLDNTMSCSLEVSSSDTGKIAIPSKMLMDILKTLPEQPLTFNIDNKTFAVEIVSDTGKYKLVGDDGDTFPKLPPADNITKATIHSDVLIQAITSTLFATSTDDMRPAMTGVLFNLSPDASTFVATDAHKMVKYARLDAKCDAESSFIVPKKSLQLLKNALSGANFDVTLAFNNSNAFFDFNNLQLICRLVDARFPDYNAVIPKENPNSLTIGRFELQNALRRISIFSNKTTHLVVFKITGNQLQLSSQDLDFSNEASEILHCEYVGNDMEIGFNAKFFIEMLSVLDSDQVKLELSMPSRAGVLYPLDKDDAEDILMLVMPVNI